MGMDLKTISQWLTEDDTKHRYDEEKGVIVFGAQGDVRTAHFIRLKEEGEMLSYQVQILDEEADNIAVPEDHEHIVVLMKYLLKENYDTKFGCWEYDHNDGDLRYSVGFPLEDATLTQKQFTRISGLMYRDVDTMMSKILKILETGEVPEDESESNDLLKKLALLKAIEDGKVDPSALGSLMGGKASSKKRDPFNLFLG